MRICQRHRVRAVPRFPNFTVSRTGSSPPQTLAFGNRSYRYTKVGAVELPSAVHTTKSGVHCPQRKAAGNDMTKPASKACQGMSRHVKLCPWSYRIRKLLGFETCKRREAEKIASLGGSLSAYCPSGTCVSGKDPSSVAHRNGQLRNSLRETWCCLVKAMSAICRALGLDYSVCGMRSTVWEEHASHPPGSSRHF